MIAAKDAVVWVNRATRQITILPRYRLPADRPDRLDWSDPIGAAYTQWQKMTNPDRIQLLLETAIDLAMNGCDLGDVLRAFAQVEEFRVLGGQSYPMCRALTKALIGKSYEFNTMDFEDLLTHYGRKAAAAE